MAIKDNLVSFWEFETGALLVDAHGSMTLTDNNSVTQTTGKVGQAAQFATANQEWLSHTDHADLEPGDADFTFTAWTYVTTGYNTTPYILSKWLSGQRSYLLYIHVAGGSAYFNLSPNINGTGNVALPITGLTTLNTWVFFVAKYDANANEMYFRANNGTAQTATQTGGAANCTADFNIGNGDNNYVDARFNGLIDQVGFWKRKITVDEETWLYNSGNGRSYAELESPSTNLMAQICL